MSEPAPADRLDQLARLIVTSPHNLVSAGQRDTEFRRRHVDEAQAVGSLLPVKSGQRWLDLGTGGGIPGLVLAMEFPDVEWVLLDSVRKKTEAVREFAAVLGLGNVSVVCGRAEELARDPELRGSFDGVVARAVAPLVTLVELARGFVRPGGLLVAVKGPAWEDEVADAGHAMSVLGWGDVRCQPVVAVRPTWVVMMSAVGEAADTVPRRAGVPQRRPLRSAG